jgi:RNA 2',3'-cyclic 3'-phosphodiesterase
MSVQLPTDRLFFALRPDVAATARIGEITQRMRAVHELAGEPLLPQHLHVTLLFLGDYAGLPPALVADAEAAGRKLRAAPFELKFDRVMSFRRKRNPPLVLCRDDSCAPLMVLRHQLGAEQKHGFRPHVTMLYDRKMVAAEEVAPVVWTASEVLLIHSLIGRKQHEVLGRYPLR